jgi:organic hydroperoxide reductase OsmC/OhrA
LWRSGKIRRWGDDGEHVMRDAGSVVMKAPPRRSSSLPPVADHPALRIRTRKLAVTLPAVGDLDEAVELVRAADRLCPYSNATRGNVEVSLTVNGRDVEATSAPVVA